MNCPQDLDLSAYADDMMTPAEKARFRAHLAGCAECQRKLESIAALGSSLRSLPSPPLGFDLAAQWDDRLRALPQRGQRTRSGWGWRGWLPAGLAGGVALASGIWLGGILLGSSAAATPGTGLVRVFDPVPPGGLCAAAEICRLSRGMP